MATYNPTTDELNAAIEDLIAKGRTDYKDIQSSLKKAHPKWKLPDRRVKKFVKRQKSGNKMTEDDESVTSGTFGRLLASRKSKKALAAEKKNKATAEAAKEEEVKKEEKEAQMPPLEKEPEEEPDLLKDMPAPADYVDANDGTKEPGLCAGCNIL